MREMHRLSGTDTEAEDHFDSIFSLKILVQRRRNDICWWHRSGSCYQHRKSQM